MDNIPELYLGRYTVIHFIAKSTSNVSKLHAYPNFLQARNLDVQLKVGATAGRCCILCWAGIVRPDELLIVMGQM